MQSWLYNIKKKILVSIYIKDLKLDLEAANLTGIPEDGMFDRINADEWLAQCDFRPCLPDELALAWSL